MRPSALLIDGNRLLAAAFEGLRRLGLAGRVTPIAIDVVEPLAAAMPEIVGIARDFAAIGRQAARLMIDRLSGALSGPPQRITLASRAVMAERPRCRAPRGRGGDDGVDVDVFIRIVGACASVPHCPATASPSGSGP